MSGDTRSPWIVANIVLIPYVAVRFPRELHDYLRFIWAHLRGTRPQAQPPPTTG